MASQQPPTDWLPAGWTVEVRKRKTGKRDKYYVDPSKSLRFNSKPEVFRYLNNIGPIKSASNEKPTDSYLKNIGPTKSTSNEKPTDNCRRSARNCVVEKIEAENLSPGRMKETSEGKQGLLISKDLSSAVSEEQKIAESGTNTQIPATQSLKSSEAEKDEQKLQSTSAGDSVPLPEQTSEQSPEGEQFSSVNIPEDKDLEQRQEKSNPTPSVESSPHVVGVLSENPVSENGVKRDGKRKSQDKKEPDVPRRASKRLAGIKADPEEELKDNPRARPVASKRSDEAKASMDERSKDLISPEGGAQNIEAEYKAVEKLGNSLPLLHKNSSSPEEQVREIENDCKTDQKPEFPPNIPSLPLLPKNLSSPEEQVREIENNCKTDQKPEFPPNIPSQDSWTDPCIDFAIKTLTGTIPVADESKAEDHPVSSGDLWTDPCIEFAIKTLTGAIPLENEIKVEENLESHQGWPFGDSWTDPCIEFAVKTLRGEIPIGNDLGIQDYLHWQVGSSISGANNSEACEKPLYKEQGLSMPKHPSGKINIQKSGNSVRHHCVNAESEKCSRGAVL